ncbi:MAG: hypothetical protein H6737_24635 [Alphaproteobacteria bacterium]|nr:hypothetical protein [Alphaproteobacteria bacterium]
MQFNAKRVAALTLLMLLPVSAFAAAAATGADGGFCASLLSGLFDCSSSGGCPHAAP